MHLLMVIDQTDKRRLFGMHCPFFFAPLLHIGEGHPLGILDIIAPIGVGVGAPVPFFGLFSMKVRGLAGNRDVVGVGLMLELDSTSEIMVMMVPGLGGPFEIILLVLLIFMVGMFFLVNEGRLIIFGLDGPQFTLLVTHII